MRTRDALALAALFSASAAAAVGEMQPGSGGTSVRSTDASPDTPTISFIDDPTVQCVGPMDELDACYVQWGYFSVTASDSQYIIDLRLSIDGRLRANYEGFFQTSMYVPGDMPSPGFKVSCGLIGSDGDPDFGHSYSWEAHARETGGLSAANYGTVQCPADYRLDRIFADGFD